MALTLFYYKDFYDIKINYINAYFKKRENEKPRSAFVESRIYFIMLNSKYYFMFMFFVYPMIHFSIKYH